MHRMVPFALLFALLSPARAEPAPPAGTEITLGDLVQQALAQNPQLARARQRVAVMRARVPQAGALPDPLLRAGVINEGRPVPFQTLGTADFSEVYLGLSQEMPFPGKRGLREDVARGELAAERGAYETMRRRIIREVAEGYYELHAARDAVAVVERNLALMDELTRVVRERFAVGQGMQQDVLGAELELTRLEERRSVLDEQQQLLEAAFARLLYRSEPLPLPRLAPLAATPLVGSQEEILAQAEKASAFLEEQRARVDAALHRLELAHKERMPDFGIELVYHDRGRRDLDPFYALGATVTLPVYATRKQQHAIEEATAELAAARSAVNDARNELRYEITAAYLRARTSERLLRLYEEGLLRQSRLVFDSATAQYQVGKVDFQTVLSSWRRTLEDEIAYRQQLAAHEKAVAQLTIEVGSPALVPPPEPAEDPR